MTYRQTEYKIKMEKVIVLSVYTLWLLAPVLFVISWLILYIYGLVCENRYRIIQLRQEVGAFSARWRMLIENSFFLYLIFSNQNSNEECINSYEKLQYIISFNSPCLKGHVNFCCHFASFYILIISYETSRPIWTKVLV